MRGAVEQEFELVINHQTARMLVLTVRSARYAGPKRMASSTFASTGGASGAAAGTGAGTTGTPGSTTPSVTRPQDPVGQGMPGGGAGRLVERKHGRSGRDWGAGAAHHQRSERWGWAKC
jgi:hypothetical protein